MPRPHPFRFPVPLPDLLTFAHPDPHSPLHHPTHIKGKVYISDSTLHLCAHRGPWHPTDFTHSPDPQTTATHLSQPWEHTPDPSSAEWRALDDIRGHIYKSNYPLWEPTPQGKHAYRTTPIWQIADHWLIRLSHLQKIARLPRVEVYTGQVHEKQAPLHIRYNSGQLLLTQDLYDPRQPPKYNRRLFRPNYHHETGTRTPRTHRPTTHHKPIPHLKDWPPKVDPDATYNPQTPT